MKASDLSACGGLVQNSANQNYINQTHNPERIIGKRGMMCQIKMPLSVLRRILQQAGGLYSRRKAREIIAKGIR